MTTATRAPTAECAHCGREFQPAKAGHVFCKRECRHRGYRMPSERVAVDPDQLVRLFDESRDPDDRVRVDDWHPTPQYPEMVRLDMVDSLRSRRRWYRNLLDLGRL